jgi:tetratricopeptide (TPR) repeat protein
VGENTRLNELRRRVQADPGSIAFAALAEEYRRVGKFQQAIEACTEGLKRHPSYLSAHVTLGRALLEVGRFDEAEQQLQFVLRAAPENLAAIRGLAEIHHRRGDHGYDVAALSALHAQAVAADAPSDVAPQVAEEPTPSAVPEAAESAAPATIIEAPAPPPQGPPSAPPPSFAPAQYDPPGTFELPEFSTPAAIAKPSLPSMTDRELRALERFLVAVVAARETVSAR